MSGEQSHEAVETEPPAHAPAAQGVAPPTRPRPYAALQSSMGNAALARALRERGDDPQAKGTLARAPGPNASFAPPNSSPASAPPPVSASPPPSSSTTTAQGETRWNLTLSTGQFDGLTPNDALLKLADAYVSLDHAIDLGLGEHQIMFGMRTDGFFNAIGAMLVEITGEDFPPTTIWDEANGKMVAARLSLMGHNVEAAAADLKAGEAAYKKASATWEAYKAQLDNAKKNAYIAIGVTAVVIIVVAAVAVVALPAAEVGGAVAEGGAVIPEAAATIPEAAATVPEAAATIPEAAATVPEAAATIPEAGMDAALGETVPGAAQAAGQTANPVLFQEILAAYRTGGAAAARIAARAMGPQALEGVLTLITVKLMGAGPLTGREETIVDELYDIVVQVWQSGIGLPGTAPP
jgi:hypothetical protein